MGVSAFLWGKAHSYSSIHTLKLTVNIHLTNKKRKYKNDFTHTLYERIWRHPEHKVSAACPCGQVFFWNGTTEHEGAPSCPRPWVHSPLTSLHRSSLGIAASSPLHLFWPILCLVGGPSGKRDGLNLTAQSPHSSKTD